MSKEFEVISMFDMFASEMPIKDVKKEEKLPKEKYKQQKDKKNGKTSECCGEKSNSKFKKPFKGYIADYSKVPVRLPIMLYCTFSGGLDLEITPEMFNSGDYLSKEEVVTLLNTYSNKKKVEAKGNMPVTSSVETEQVTSEGATEQKNNVVSLYSSESNADDEELKIEDDEIEEREMDGKRERTKEADSSAKSKVAEVEVSVVEADIEDGTYVTLETIRIILQRRFPFFTKERSRLEFDKKENYIVGTVFVGQKGYVPSPFETEYASLEDAVNSNSPLSVVRGVDGYYRVEKTKIGTMCTKVLNDDTEIKKEGDVISPFFDFKMPKIPFSLLLEILEYFKVYASDNSMAEALVQICYDKINNKYFISVPEQKTSFDSVTYVLDKFQNPKSDAVVVMTMHSHPSFDGEFSSIDDEDEQVTGLYGVIGRIFESIPQINIRVSCSGSFIYCGMDQIFINDLER